MDDKNWDALLDIIETLRDFGNGVWIGLESTNLKYVSQEYLKRLGQSIKKTGCGTVYPCLQGNRLHVPYWECPTALDIVDELNPKTKSGDFSSQNMVYIDFDPELRFPIFDDVDNRTDANNNDNSSSHSQISDFRHELGLSTSDEVDDDSDDDSDDNSSHTQKLKKNRCSSSRNPKYCNQN